VKFDLASPGPLPLPPPVLRAEPYPLVGHDDPVPVYAGPARLGRPGAVFDVEVLVALRWRPTPWICWNATPADSAPAVASGLLASLGAHDLRLLPPPGLELPPPPPTADWRPAPGTSLAGRESVVRVGTDAPVTEVRFLLVNMPRCRRADPVSDGRGAWLGRERLDGDGWTITLDSRGDEPEATLGDRGGYAVTHVGRLRRCDGSPFSRDDALDALALLTHVCSLSAGRWVATALPVGVDAEGVDRWSEWASPRVDAWRTELSFTDATEHDHLPDLFRACSRRWHQGERARWTLRRAVHYYLRANDAAPLQWSVVAAVSACELLAGALLLEDPDSALSDADLPNLDFPRHGKEALRLARTESRIPLSLERLTRHANTWHSGASGPKVLHEMRHSVVHPRAGRPDEDASDTEVWTEAWRLALDYYQLLLLRWLAYRGTRHSPLTVRGWVGQTQPMPWTDDRPPMRPKRAT